MFQFIVTPILLCLCALFILWWIRGARMRRFNNAYSMTRQGCWTEADEPFLRYLESAYALQKGAAGRLPETETPMGLYLVLYPEHCIYDANENLKFLRAYYQGRPIPFHSDLLTESFRTLAEQWKLFKQRS